MDAVHQVHTWNSTQRQAEMLLNVYVEGQNEVVTTVINWQCIR